jgi:hypothetical protein
MDEKAGKKWPQGLVPVEHDKEQGTWKAMTNTSAGYGEGLLRRCRAEVPTLIGLVNVAFCMRRYFSSEMKGFRVHPVEDAP